MVQTGGMDLLRLRVADELTDISLLPAQCCASGISWGGSVGELVQEVAGSLLSFEGGAFGALAGSPEFPLAVEAQSGLTLRVSRTGAPADGTMLPLNDVFACVKEIALGVLAGPEPAQHGRFAQICVPPSDSDAVHLVAPDPASGSASGFTHMNVAKLGTETMTNYTVETAVGITGIEMLGWGMMLESPRSSAHWVLQGYYTGILLEPEIEFARLIGFLRQARLLGESSLFLGMDDIAHLLAGAATDREVATEALQLFEARAASARMALWVLSRSLQVGSDAEWAADVVSMMSAYETVLPALALLHVSPWAAIGERLAVYYTTYAVAGFSDGSISRAAPPGSAPSAAGYSALGLRGGGYDFASPPAAAAATPVPLQAGAFTMVQRPAAGPPQAAGPPGLPEPGTPSPRAPSSSSSSALPLGSGDPLPAGLAPAGAPADRVPAVVRAVPVPRQPPLPPGPPALPVPGGTPPAPVSSAEAVFSALLVPQYLHASPFALQLGQLSPPSGRGVAQQLASAFSPPRLLSTVPGFGEGSDFEALSVALHFAEIWAVVCNGGSQLPALFSSPPGTVAESLARLSIVLADFCRASSTAPASAPPPAVVPPAPLPMGGPMPLPGPFAPGGSPPPFPRQPPPPPPVPLQHPPFLPPPSSSPTFPPPPYGGPSSHASGGYSSGGAPPGKIPPGADSHGCRPSEFGSLQHYPVKTVALGNLMTQHHILADYVRLQAHVSSSAADPTVEVEAQRLVESFGRPAVALACSDSTHSGEKRGPGYPISLATQIVNERQRVIDKLHEWIEPGVRDFEPAKSGIPELTLGVFVGELNFEKVLMLLPRSKAPEKTKLHGTSGRWGSVVRTQANYAKDVGKAIQRLSQLLDLSYGLRIRTLLGCQSSRPDVYALIEPYVRRRATDPAFTEFAGDGHYGMTSLIERAGDDDGADAAGLARGYDALCWALRRWAESFRELRSAAPGSTSVVFPDLAYFMHRSVEMHLEQIEKRDDLDAYSASRVCSVLDQRVTAAVAQHVQSMGFAPVRSSSRGAPSPSGGLQPIALPVVGQEVSFGDRSRQSPGGGLKSPGGGAGAADKIQAAQINSVRLQQKIDAMALSKPHLTRTLARLMAEYLDSLLAANGVDPTKAQCSKVALLGKCIERSCKRCELMAPICTSLTLIGKVWKHASQQLKEDRDSGKLFEADSRPSTPFQPGGSRPSSALSQDGRTSRQDKRKDGRDSARSDRSRSRSQSRTRG